MPKIFESKASIHVGSFCETGAIDNSGLSGKPFFTAAIDRIDGSNNAQQSECKTIKFVNKLPKEKIIEPRIISSKFF